MKENETINSHPEPHCYLCNTEGIVLYENVEDKIYGAPGEWNIKKCPNPKCALIWLDPMPNEEELWKAYKNYYTHNEATILVPKFLRTFEKPYLSLFYGYYKSTPLLNKLTGLVFILLPTEKVNVDFSVLWLQNAEKRNLLDIGCGNGSFIEKMQNLGWTTTGIDFDQKAVDFCISKGLNAQKGDLKGLSYEAESFDVITLNHVIEHLYDPADTISECCRILKPGGKIVITTPNSQSWMFNLWFKDSWYALQSPAHLHIFSLKNLSGMLIKKGFEIKKARTTSRIESWIYYTSRIIKKEGHFDFSKKHGKIFHVIGRMIQLITVFYLIFDKTKGNEILIIAQKTK